MYVDETVLWFIRGAVLCADGDFNAPPLQRHNLPLILLIYRISDWARRFLVYLHHDPLRPLIPIQIRNLRPILRQPVIQLVVADLRHVPRHRLLVLDELQHVSRGFGEALVQARAVLGHLHAGVDVFVVVWPDLFLFDPANCFEVALVRAF